MDRSIQAENEKERIRREEQNGIAIPKPKAAVMNVDVQIVLSRVEYKTFAEAKPNAASRVADGEPLWLYVRFNGKLGDYVLTTLNPEDQTKLKYSLFAEVGPQGDVTALNQYLLQFTRDDLAASELKINLAPGLFGRNKSIPVFLKTAAGGKPGVWNNELRLANSPAVPRGVNDHLAKSAVTLDFSSGLAKYSKMAAQYDSIILRGTTDVAKMPIAGTFFSDPLKAQILNKLKSEGVTPVKFYFSGDDWTESAASTFNAKQIRKVFATYTYQKAKNCFYGVAEIVQIYDFMASKYGESTVNLQKDFPIQCIELN